MTLSVVIPTYNRAADLTRCLNSLVAQTVQDFEVLVCDDGSTDDTAEVAAGFADRLNLQYLHGPHTGGPARPRNLGIHHAAGEWIAFLDSDDWWYPRKVEACRPNLPGHDVVYHRVEIVTPAGVTDRLVGRDVTHPVLIDLLTYLNAIPNSGALVRRDVVREAGGLSEDRGLVAVEDYDLWIRLAQRTERFCFMADTLGAYWEVGAGPNLSASPDQIARERHVFQLHRHHLSDEQCREAERNWDARHEALRAADAFPQ